MTQIETAPARLTAVHADGTETLVAESPGFTERYGPVENVRVPSTLALTLETGHATQVLAELLHAATKPRDLHARPQDTAEELAAEAERAKSTIDDLVATVRRRAANRSAVAEMVAERQRRNY